MLALKTLVNDSGHSPHFPVILYRAVTSGTCALLPTPPPPPPPPPLKKQTECANINVPFWVFHLCQWPSNKFILFCNCFLAV